MVGVLLLGRFCCLLGIVLLRLFLGWEGVFPWRFFVAGILFWLRRFWFLRFLFDAVSFCWWDVCFAVFLNRRILFLGSSFFCEVCVTPREGFASRVSFLFGWEALVPVIKGIIVMVLQH